MSRNTEAKYRPVLSATQIDTLLDLCKSCMTLTPEVMSCIATLAPFQAKVHNAGIVPAYNAAKKETVEEQLGFVGQKPTVDYETSRLLAFNKYEKNPGACTLKELELAHTYRWEKGMMSREEEILFEGNPHKFLSAGLIDTDSPILDTDSENDDDTNTNT